MTRIQVGCLSVAILLLSAILFSLSVVTEGHRGLLLRGGSVVIDSDTGKAKIISPGLQFKWPFLDEIRVFDVRLQTLVIRSLQLKTLEHADLNLDFFVNWRIKDLPVYYKKTGGNIDKTQLFLEQQLSDSLSDELKHHNLGETVPDDTWLKQTNKIVSDVGLEIVDVRIQQIVLPDEAGALILTNMRSQFQQKAITLRAQGKIKADDIRAGADAQVDLTMGRTKLTAATVRAESDAKAANIYANAYGREPKFYSFYRSLLAYKAVFANQENVWVIKPDSDFFKYFKK